MSHASSPTTSVVPATPWRALAPIFVYFAAAGVVTVMLGPLLPSFIHRWQLKDAQAGTLFTTFFAGQFAGAWFATRRLRLSMIAGAALMAAGCGALTWTSFHGAHIALFACGLGLGAGLTAGNVVTGTSSEGRARVLAVLNVSWSLGAIASPALIRTAGASFFVLAATMVALAGVLVAASRGLSATSARSAGASESAPIPLPWPTIVMFAAAMMLYIGSENSLGGWLPSFASRNDPALNAATIAFWYWLAELAGRLLLAAAASLLPQSLLYRGLLGGLLVSQMTLLLNPHPASSWIAASAIVSGVCLGPLYPLIVAFLLARTGQHPRLGALFASASVGGAVLPWLTGVVSTRFGGLRMGLLVPATGVLCMFLLSGGMAGGAYSPGARKRDPA